MSNKKVQKIIVYIMLISMILLTIVSGLTYMFTY